MLIPRAVKLKEKLTPGKVLIIYGPRQVGKTTLVREFLNKTKLRWRFDTGDNLELAQTLAKCTYQTTANHVGDYELIVIDEAQKIPNIGRALKLMVDSYPDRYFIATGSSAFDLANKAGESLTGRKRLIHLYPISLYELAKIKAPSELQTQLESHLIYGMYPEVVTATHAQQKREIISTIAQSYLLKDILAFESLKKADLILKLLRLLALQLGSQVSTSELATNLGIDTKTVIRYLDLLQKSFIIFPLRGFSRNLRKEVTKMDKYYFYDVGVRNAFVLNFNSLELRNDVGALWENFIISERVKFNHYTEKPANYYFWRTYSQQEIDLIEEADGKLSAYEFKFNPKKTPNPPKEWQKHYPDASWEVVTPNNYLDFVTKK